MLLTHPGRSLGEVKPALWAQEEELCFLVRAECKTLQPSSLPHPLVHQVSEGIAGASTQPRWGVKVTLNSLTLTSHSQSCSKRIQPPGSPLTPAVLSIHIVQPTATPGSQPQPAWVLRCRDTLHLQFTLHISSF